MYVNLFYYIKEQWSPALQIHSALLSVQALLSAPNPDDPLAADVAKQWKTDENAAISMGMLPLSRVHELLYVYSYVCNAYKS